MGIFASILGGAVKNLDAGELFKGVATHATAEFSKPFVSEVFQKMKVEGRAKLADHLEKIAAALRDGRCNDAADTAAEVIGEIKL